MQRFNKLRKEMWTCLLKGVGQVASSILCKRSSCEEKGVRHVKCNSFFSPSLAKEKGVRHVKCNSFFSLSARQIRSQPLHQPPQLS
jgi:hypothetical protein